MPRNFDYPVPQEGAMAQNFLWQIEQDARSLHDKLQPTDELPGWVNAYVATAADRMQMASRYMQHKMAMQGYGALPNPRKNMTSLQHDLVQLLATLKAIKFHAWTSHWKASGPNYYSDHLLFQRIYEGTGGGPLIDAEIDGLGERIVALCGNDSINAADITARTQALLTQAVGTGAPCAAALSLELQASDLVAKLTKQAARMSGPFSVNLDNFLRTIADDRSTVTYLLQQRIRTPGYGDAFGCDYGGLLGPEGGNTELIVTAGLAALFLWWLMHPGEGSGRDRESVLDKTLRSLRS